jgi:hypothetical protein
MELWQMDVMTGVLLEDGTALKVVTGIDDHSRFCVAAGLVARATSRANEFPDALWERMAEAIDALIIVTRHIQMCPVFRKRADNLEFAAV